MIGEIKIAIIGLGYVGLPLATEYSKKFKVIGYDSNKDRILELESGIDRTAEIDDIKLLKNDNLRYTDKQSDVDDCNVYIISVPTPIDHLKKPDLTALSSACDIVGRSLKIGEKIPGKAVLF